MQTEPNLIKLEPVLATFYSIGPQNGSGLFYKLPGPTKS